MLEELGASPETVVQLFHHVDTEASVELERIVELVSSLEPGADEENSEQLEIFHYNCYDKTGEPLVTSCPGKVVNICLVGE